MIQYGYSIDTVCIHKHNKNKNKNKNKEESIKEEKANGLKGGRPKKNNLANKPNGFSENQMVNSESKKNLYVNVNDNVNDNKEENIKEEKPNGFSETKKFVKPTLKEIEDIVFSSKCDLVMIDYLGLIQGFIKFY